MSGILQVHAHAIAVPQETPTTRRGSRVALLKAMRDKQEKQKSLDEKKKASQGEEDNDDDESHCK